MNSVTCLAWVKRGAAKQRPDRVVLNDEDLKRVIDTQSDKLRRLEVGDDSESEEEELKRKPVKNAEKPSTSGDSSAGQKRKAPGEDAQSAQEAADEDKDVIDKYGLDDYDDDEGGREVGNDNDDDEEDSDEDGPGALGGIAHYATKRDDPYLDQNKEDSDDEDLEVKPDDNLIVVGKVHGEFCNLEVYLYNDDQNELYCHHDILLPSFPLALEWIDYDPGESAPGNLVAMGTMEPDIEIWDIDVVDGIVPAYVLKGAEVKLGKKKKKKTSDSGHTDAVLDLSWNKNQRKVLASASADFSVGIWDLEQGVMATSLTSHTEKVQSVAWHPVEAQTLVSGSFDHTVRVYDCRNPQDGQKFWTLAGEVERVLWNHHNPYNFLASTESGHVYCIDVRETKPLFSLHAHSGAVTGLSMSPTIPGCLVTTSDDKILRVWDIRGNAPVQVHKKQLAIGELHCAMCSTDSPLVVGVGGERELRVINLQRNLDVCKHFNIEQAEPSVRDRKREQNGMDDEDSDDDGIGEVHAGDSEDELDMEPPSAAAAANSEGATGGKKKKKIKKKKKKPRTSSLERPNK